MYAQRLGVDRANAQPVGAVSIPRRAPRVRLRQPGHRLNPWATVRAATAHHTPGSAVSARAAFSAATRGAWRAGGVRDGVTGTLVPGAPASYAIWEAGDLEVSAPATRRSGGPPIRAPGCRRCRGWADSGCRAACGRSTAAGASWLTPGPAIPPTPPTTGRPYLRGARFGAAVVARLIRLALGPRRRADVPEFSAGGLVVGGLPVAGPARLGADPRDHPLAGGSATACSSGWPSICR